MSPCKKNNGKVVDSEDQMFRIFKFIGKQSNDQLSFIKEDNITMYCKSLMKGHKPQTRVDSKFSSISQEYRDILLQMIVFNPEHRLSAKELLKNPIFDEIRFLPQEEDAEIPVIMPFEQDGCYDYD